MVVEAPIRWIDAFPSSQRDNGNLFFGSSIAISPEHVIEPDGDFSHEMISAIAESRANGALDGYFSEEDSRIVDLFPSIAYVSALSQLALPVPIFNLLLRSGISTMEEFLNLTFYQFHRIPGVGYKKERQLAESLTKFVLNQIRRGTFWAEIEGALANQDAPSNLKSLSRRNPERVEAERLLVQEVTKFAYFLHFRNQSESPITTSSLPRNLDYFRADYNVELAQVTAAKWLSDSLIPSIADLVNLFEETYATSAASVTILRERVFSSNPKSLEVIGEMVNLTRERIRQIEKKLLDQFEGYVDEDEYLVHALRAVKSFCVVPIPRDDLLDLLPALKSKSNSGVLAIDFISYFGGVESREGWYCNSFAATNDLIANAIERSKADNNIINHSKLAFFAGKDWYSNGLNHLARWMAYLGYQKYKDNWLLGSSLPQSAFLVLATEGKPLRGTQIIESLESERSIRSLENGLALDERFVRVSKNEWGLAEWGEEAYEGIQEAIGKHIDDHGSTHIDELVAIFAEKYKIKPASIKAYASGAKFAIVDGYVKRSSVLKTGRKPVAKTKNLYKTEHGYALRIQIKKDHQRGSGSVCPAALTSAYEVSGSVKKTFVSEFGPITISHVSLSSNITSIKRVCDGLGLKIGDNCILVFEGETVTTKKVDLSVTGTKLVAELANLGSVSDLKSQLSSAFGLDQVVDFEGLMEIALSRKEKDLVEALEKITPRVL